MKPAASLHFSPPFVARRRKVVPYVSFATEECAGIVDTMSSALTELKSCRVRHSGVCSTTAWMQRSGVPEVEQRMEQLPRGVVRNAG